MNPRPSSRRDKRPAGDDTEDVEALHKQFRLPSMAVMQFGFGHDAKSSDYPPRIFTWDLVACRGTQDNDTIAAP